ncbi:MAG: hypothetical protein JSV61_01725 [Anaerolineales bacterium]|nr:MAG: hypothetical protein JSV61_01725 [Anaerolineales bacterium]
MRKNAFILLASITLLLVFVSIAYAQAYSFQMPQATVHIFWNEDGTVSIDYIFTFANDAGAHPIDYVDVGLPNPSFNESSISADVAGNPVYDISRSGFQGSGPGVDTGVAIGLGAYTIPPGETGQVHVNIGEIENMLRFDSGDKGYASGVFAPAWFQTVRGNTDVSVTFHLPPGIQPEEPRWHSAPSGWPSEPETGLDEDGRVTYTWASQIRMDRKYDFGASFPVDYIPETAIYSPGFLESLGVAPDDVIGGMVCGGFILFFMLSAFLSIRGAQRRQLQYMPPKISIEGHGIKRGLTAIEAAILMEQPLDKILTMILFATIKKGGATVTKKEPLTIELTDPLPEDLQPYEVDFLKAFTKTNPAQKRTALQDMMIELVRSVSKKMKGFSRKETLAYYKAIVQKAWVQVEAADTPEVKSQKYDEVMEWTMLDRDYDDRTRRVFHGGPVFVPVWWSRYDPSFSRGATAAPVSAAGGGGGGITLPHLPGSDFAASMVKGVQNFSSGVVGNLTDFTSKVTNKTNPVPVSTSRSSSRSSGGGGGGCACACACACAGCACACAGGGR